MGLLGKKNDKKSEKKAAEEKARALEAIRELGAKAAEMETRLDKAKAELLHAYDKKAELREKARDVVKQDEKAAKLILLEKQDIEHEIEDIENKMGGIREAIRAMHSKMHQADLALSLGNVSDALSAIDEATCMKEKLPDIFDRMQEHIMEINATRKDINRFTNRNVDSVALNEELESLIRENDRDDMVELPGSQADDDDIFAQLERQANGN
ncbi:hypothetical protein GMRT_10965 [Giardia muris]|uniref:Uncharacterized protein n=1 Tax=Giardia muris TaxID=5742 RepID=A0A4Z1T0X2_GIAMU|nr:hypothetical protein GMRT_10965 [Giardia muris]|eukprot:TNJ29348.1 hypothetical protein GMRT_10965 [Giardia muris]